MIPASAGLHTPFAPTVASTWHVPRRGRTFIEVVVSTVVLVLAGFNLLPVLYHAIQLATQTGCQFNLRSIGLAVDSYQSSRNGLLPIGSRALVRPGSSWGTSWWLEVLDQVEAWPGKTRWRAVPSGGSFREAEGNLNLPRLDGFHPSIMGCPSSPLPAFNRPEDLSAANWQLLSPQQPRGIAVPTYVAIAGSFPDMKGVDLDRLNEPQGRNTRAGELGVLSASGAFPPNQSRRLAHLTDGLRQTILIGEQSSWGVDEQFEPPVYFEERSSWPGGAYLGTSVPYGDLSPTADGFNGSGEAPCYNVTTLRWPLNTRYRRPGRRGELASPQPGRATNPAEPELDRGAYEPGHNQGLFSPHRGGVNVLFADGSVQFLAEEIDLTILLKLATRDDGG